jgi:hypothetical protein
MMFFFISIYIRLLKWEKWEVLLYPLSINDLEDFQSGKAVGRSGKEWEAFPPIFFKVGRYIYFK